MLSNYIHSLMLLIHYINSPMLLTTLSIGWASLHFSVLAGLHYIQYLLACLTAYFLFAGSTDAQKVVVHRVCIFNEILVYLCVFKSIFKLGGKLHIFIFDCFL